MKIYPIQAFSDNYIWLIEKDADAIVIDPGEANQVLAHLEEKQLDLKGVLLTHNHEDHTGGVNEILETYPNVSVYGPNETKDYANHLVEAGKVVELLGIRFEVLKTAGHTEGHISYLTEDWLFCGDALFSGGCGRVFTGDYSAQYAAFQTFKQLADDITVYPAHEYTVTNLEFAQSIERENEKIAEALKRAKQLRAEDLPTLPTAIKKEKEINLFMQAEDLDRFIDLRQTRDDF